MPARTSVSNRSRFSGTPLVTRFVYSPTSRARVPECDGFAGEPRRTRFRLAIGGAVGVEVRARIGDAETAGAVGLLEEGGVARARADSATGLADLIGRDRWTGPRGTARRARR